MKASMTIDKVLMIIIFVIVLTVVIMIFFLALGNSGKIENLSQLKENTTPTYPNCTVEELCKGYEDAKCMYNPPDPLCTNKIKGDDYEIYNCSFWIPAESVGNCTEDKMCMCKKMVDLPAINLSIGGNRKWYVGLESQSCDDVCKMYGKECEEFSDEEWENLINDLKSDNLCKIQQILGFSCNSCEFVKSKFGIYTIGSYVCYVGNLTPSCDSSDPTYTRICACQ